jgi:phospholipid-binding lipoprotein MlaA
VNYLEDDSTRYLIRAVDVLDLRTGLLDLDAQLEKSYDRYAFVRTAWLQRREYMVTDGNIEDPALELEAGMEEEPAAETEAPPPPGG